MLYFLYMSTTIPNTLFHQNLSNGTIEYINKYPFVVKKHFMFGSSINNNFTEQENISLLEAQKHVLKNTEFIGFTFDTSHNSINIQDISRGTIGNAYFYKNNSTISSATDRTAYLIKNNGMSESQFTEADDDYYFGDLDYVKFTIPPTDISDISHNMTNLSYNLAQFATYPPSQMNDVAEILVQAVGNQELYIDYYFYIWEDMNGPWFNGSSLSMTPNSNQLINNGITRPVHFNDISNQAQINTADASGNKLYTYDYSVPNVSDTSSNFIKVFKLGGSYGVNNGLPEKSSIIFTSPKYTKYNFLWTYAIRNSYKLIFTYDNGTVIEYLLEGYSPFYTPTLNISGNNWNYDSFSSMGTLDGHFTTLNVERIYKAITPIDLSYNTGVITLTIPEQDVYDLSENFVKRYQPEGRKGNKYLINPITKKEYIHLHENNEITRLTYNIYFFIDEEIQYGKTASNIPIDLSNNTLTQNINSYPYGDNFVNISYTQIVELSDNSVYFETIPKATIDFGDLAGKYDGVNSEGISRNRYNNEDDLDGTPSEVNAQTTINNDTIDKYFAYENNTVLNTQILYVRRQDLINTPYYAHLVSSNDWTVVYKFFNINPTTSQINYNMSSNKYFIRWNYNITRYQYNKNFPIDEKQAYLNKTSFNSGISNLRLFDFTEFGKRVYPNSLLDLTYSSLPHYTNNVIDYYYKNLNISIPQDTLDRLTTNIFFNHNELARAKLNIYIFKPNTINGANQQNNYDTRDINYNLFDLSYSFYDSTKTLPLKQNISIDISENGRDDTLISGQYIVEWDYEIVVDGGVSANYLPFDKSSTSGEYQVNSGVINVPYNDFLYDLSGLSVYANSSFTNLFLEFDQKNIEKFVDYINIYHKTLDITNTILSFNFLLFTPNKEESQTSGNIWSLPSGYQGREDPRIYQTPTTYLNKTIVPSPTLIHENVNLYGDIGIDSRYASYTSNVNEFYKMVKIYDISNTTNINLGNEIPSSLRDISNYIIEMVIPEGQTNHTDISANFGVGSIDNFNIQKVLDKQSGVHLGLLTDSSNNTIAYYKDGNPYYLNTLSGESISGKIRWMMEEKNNNISVTVSINNKKGIYLETAGFLASRLSKLGSGATDMSQNMSTIKVYDKRNNSENILMTDISRTDIIFHQIRDPTIIGGNDTVPLSHIHTNSTFQIPYICRMDYKIHDRTNNFKFDSIIRKKNYELNNIYHRIEDWDISYNTTSEGILDYSFNKTAENPFSHKYVYGVGFISPIDYDITNFYYPGKLDLLFNESRRTLTLEITDQNLLYLTFNLVELWNAVNDRTSVQFIYFGWEPKSTRIKSLISNSLDPNLANDMNNVVTELSGVDYTNTNVDFMYTIASNTSYEENSPRIPKTVFIINETDLKSGIYYVGWSYIINNTYNINKIPPTRDYDLSLATIIIPSFQYKPNQVNIDIDDTISQVKLTISQNEIIDMSKNIYFKNYGFEDISEVKINFYLWTPDNVIREDNSGGWLLPDDYIGLNDVRIKEFPVIYYDNNDKVNKLYDISYNGGYGLDKSKAHVKTLKGKHLYDLSCAVFTLADLSLNNLPYSNKYSRNGNQVPYISIWNYELVMKNTSEYAGISIQSDISNTSDVNFEFRNPDWIINYELLFNNNKTNIEAKLNTSDFYNYSLNSVVDDVTNNIRKFVNVKLDVIDGTDELSYHKLDNSGNNILLNTIQINETQYNNNTVYLHNLYSTQGIQRNVEIPTTATGGSWTFNAVTGTINFQSTPYSPIVINSNNPIYFTFYKRINTTPLNEIFKKSQASFQNTTFNKYFYNCKLLIEPVVQPEPIVVFNSYRCTAEGCFKETTKTKENKNFIQRYSSLFNVNFKLASKISFDCGLGNTQSTNNQVVSNMNQQSNNQQSNNQQSNNQQSNNQGGGY
jgi:hypothetical protein